MILRRLILGALTAAPLLLGSVAYAGEPGAYTPAAFETAQKAGGPVLVHVTAPWCSVCKAQKPILSKLEADPKFKAMQVFNVDFDSQKDAVASFAAQQQSTLIVYKDGKEVGRSTGETSAEAIQALLDKGV